LKSEAHKFFVVNIMTQPGETDGYSAYDHLRVLVEHTDPRLVETCVVNVHPVPSEMVAKYREKGAGLARLDLDLMREKGYEVLEGTVLKVDGQVRHDPTALARLIFDHHLRLSRAAA
jgi:uncharacterized cofD-like protein